MQTNSNCTAPRDTTSSLRASPRQDLGLQLLRGITKRTADGGRHTWRSAYVPNPYKTAEPNQTKTQAKQSQHPTETTSRPAHKESQAKLLGPKARTTQVSRASEECQMSRTRQSCYSARQFRNNIHVKKARRKAMPGRISARLKDPVGRWRNRQRPSHARRQGGDRSANRGP